jgi:hypothetical protein
VNLTDIILQLRGTTVELVGGTHSLTAGTQYWLLTGTVGTHVRGRFTATAGDAAAFTAATQRVSTEPFGRRIGGAADLPLVSGETLAVPAAFVVPLAESASPNTLSAGLHQVITNRFGVVVCLDNARTEDGGLREKRGLTAALELAAIRTWLFSRLLNWKPTWAWQPLEYSASRLIDMDRAMFWWIYEFEYESLVSDSDGYQVTADDLDEIHVAGSVGPRDVLTGGTDTLQVGATYYILAGDINGKTQGYFEATAADAADFTSPTQTVRAVDIVDIVDLT